MNDELRRAGYRLAQQCRGVLRHASILLGPVLCGLLSSTAAERTGPPHVENTDAPAHGIDTVQLERLWKIGGFSEADEELFGVITDVVVDPLGRTYLLDLQLEEIKVFSPAGQYERTIGQPGDGPGDLRAPRCLFVLPDDKLCVIQEFPLRMTLFDFEGNPAGQLQPVAAIGDGYHSLLKAVFRENALTVESLDNVTGKGVIDNIRRLIRVDLDGNEVAEYARSVRRIDFALKLIKEKDTDTFRWTVGPDGHVYVNPGWEYRVETWSSDGKLQRTLGRDYAHRYRSHGELERVRARYRLGTRGEGKTELMDHDRDIVELYARNSGKLWVLTSRGARPEAEDSLGVFDVFDRAGRFQKQVDLRGDGNYGEDRYYFVRDRLYVLKHYADASRAWSARFHAEDVESMSEVEPEPMAVICYRIPEEAIR